MVSVRVWVLPLVLVFMSCRSEDPRLPQQLYDEAILMNQKGKQLEARTLMAQLAAKYPDTPAGQQASKDLYLMDALLRQDLLEHQRQLRSIMKRTADALTRYKGKHGEYPRFLSSLVPDYLEQEPETPWKHPFFYRPFVSVPILNTKDRKGRPIQVLGSKLDSYHLACLGVDLQPGGDNLAADTFIVNGEFYKEKTLPAIPQPQPVK
ncbi:MAG: hypothetical protein P4L36_16950 [Holophaga sp.]|nr:hypothetical protein [Holophaga sp.]